MTPAEAVAAIRTSWTRSPTLHASVSLSAMGRVVAADSPLAVEEGCACGAPLPCGGQRCAAALDVALKALENINAGDQGCGCEEHSGKNEWCCAVVGEPCAHCESERALVQMAQALQGEKP